MNVAAADRDFQQGIMRASQQAFNLAQRRQTHENMIQTKHVLNYASAVALNDVADLLYDEGKVEIEPSESIKLVDQHKLLPSTLQNDPEFIGTGRLQPWALPELPQLDLHGSRGRNTKDKLAFSTVDAAKMRVSHRNLGGNTMITPKVVRKKQQKYNSITVDRVRTDQNRLPILPTQARGSSHILVERQGATKQTFFDPGAKVTVGVNGADEDDDVVNVGGRDHSRI